MNTNFKVIGLTRFGIKAEFAAPNAIFMCLTFMVLLQSNATRSFIPVKVSYFPGFSSSQETANFQINFRDFQLPKKIRDSRDAGNSREIFPVIFLEFGYFAIFSDFQHFRSNF